MAVELDVDRFYSRLRKLHTSFVKQNKNFWNGAKCLCLHRGALNDDEPYLRSVVLHQWLFGYELPDTILLITEDGNVWICATKKKCEFLKTAKDKDEDFTLNLLLRNKDDSNAANYTTLLKHAHPRGEENNKIGVILKERTTNAAGGGILGPFEEELDGQVKEKIIELVDISPGLAVVMAPKDGTEWDLMKKSSVLSNKVMKHGFVKKLEEIIEEEGKITHDAFATEIEGILEDPNRIKLNVPQDDVQSCYFPIVQSGGTYDIRVSAQSTSENLSPDIIMVSLGARYRLYCSNIARTFLVDPPKKVSETYEILLELQEACIDAMRAGSQLKSVMKAAVSWLTKNGHDHLIEKLPKNLGFAQGLEFRDSNLLLSAKNPVTFKPGMVFCLSLGFQDLELTSKDLEGTPNNSAVKNLKKYSLLVSDMISIANNKRGELLTKMGKAITDIAYNVNDDDDGDDDEDGSDEDDEDAKLARKLAKEQAEEGGRRSKRLAKDQGASAEAAEGAAERERRQILLMKRRNEERLREIARENMKNKGKNNDEDQAQELEAYRSTKDFPANTQPNQVKVDMANQCVLLPIFGNSIPFHISTIKNVVLPDADNDATLLRINFYTAGMAVGKDAPANMAKLVLKYAPYASFIREMCFRSLDGHNLVTAFRQISELRKRARAKEILAQEEADLVVQEKLVRTKNERVPRLSDLTMRPVFAGKKTQGNLEAHSNGLRFISTRSEVIDIMYKNIKYAIFQPCENEIMVLVHFHLKNPIMIGKKKQKDIQFFTEVVDASQAVDNGRRSMYDPDEMDDEHRERQLRKRLNGAFKDFCKKVDAVAKKNGYQLEFDIPYRDLGFIGNPHKEMVKILPTLNCLVNLTETPFFVVDLDHVDHVHFERITYTSKAFDIKLINKDFTKMPWSIDMIPNGDKDSIQDWLTDMEITYTEGPANLNWKQILATAKEDDRFYMTTEEDEVTEKEGGWEVLRMFGREDEEEDDDEDDEDPDFGQESVDEEEDEEEESDEEDFDSEEDDESDFDADEELEEQGMDWEDMEREAAAEDKQKRRTDIDDDLPRKKQRRSSGGNRPTSAGRRTSGARRGSAAPGRSKAGNRQQRRR